MSSEIKVSSVKAKDGTAGISIADSTGNVSLSGTLSAGTLGSSVTGNWGWKLLQTVSGNDDVAHLDVDQLMVEQLLF